MVAWAAATGSLAVEPILLFLIIFFWTPPHFWALSLYIATDYAAAGVPMMPVVKGPKSTRAQILAYSLVLAPLGVAPAFTGLGGKLYLGVASLGGLAFVILAVRLALSTAGDGEPGATGLYAVKPGAKEARDLFAFSIGYLFVLFAALLFEHALKAFAG